MSQTYALYRSFFVTRREGAFGAATEAWGGLENYQRALQDELARTHALVQAFLQLSERMRRHYADRVAEFDLTPTQAHLLRELRRRRRD